MLVAAIKADALSCEDPAPILSTESAESPFSPTAGPLSRTTSAAVMSSTFSYTLLKRAQLSSIWNAVEFSALDTDRYCALAHTCLITLVKTANDADFEGNAYFPNPPTEYSDVVMKLRDNGSSVVLVAALEIAATHQVVGDFVAMGLGGTWNAVFDDTCSTDSTSLDSTSLSIVLSTVRMKSSASSFRVLQARDDSLQSESEPKQSKSIIALRSVGPLSVSGSASSSQDAQLLFGFVIQALEDSRSSVT